MRKTFTKCLWTLTVAATIATTVRATPAEAPPTKQPLPRLLTIPETMQLKLASRLEKTKRREVRPEPKPKPKPKPKPTPAPATRTFIVTAYTAGPESTGKAPGHPAYGVTASGVKAVEGRTVACPPDLPFGTIVVIEGLGERVCQDRGGAIKGDRLDVFMANRSQAVQFGKRRLAVTIRR